MKVNCSVCYHCDHPQQILSEMITSRVAISWIQEWGWVLQMSATKKHNFLISYSANTFCIQSSQRTHRNMWHFFLHQCNHSFDQKLPKVYPSQARLQMHKRAVKIRMQNICRYEGRVITYLSWRNGVKQSGCCLVLWYGRIVPQNFLQRQLKCFRQK